jgi:hypothetical protein
MRGLCARCRKARYPWFMLTISRYRLLAVCIIVVCAVAALAPGERGTRMIGEAHAQPVPRPTATGSAQAKANEVCQRVDKCLDACQRTYLPCSAACLGVARTTVDIKACLKPCADVRNKCINACKPEECKRTE